MAADAAPARRPGELSFAGRRRLFLIGAAGLGALLLWGLAGLPDYRDFTPLYGQVMNAVSAGTIPLLSLAVGIEVSGGFVLLLSEFLTQLLVIRREQGPEA